jgi:hypothetical protein
LNVARAELLAGNARLANFEASAHLTNYEVGGERWSRLLTFGRKYYWHSVVEFSDQLICCGCNNRARGNDVAALAPRIQIPANVTGSPSGE